MHHKCKVKTSLCKESLRFSLYGRFGDFLTSCPFYLDVEGQVFMYQMKANMFIYNVSKFLADTTTIKFLVIFKISELMFFGHKKKLRPGEKFCLAGYIR
jgi:hypothetical protein